MTTEKLDGMAIRFLTAWNSQQVEAVVACYTDDVSYRDPNTRGVVHGSDALRRYLSKLFGAWQMQWFLKEAYPLQEEGGAAILWRATFQRKNRGRILEVHGMDIVFLTGDRIKRNEVYFDRMRLLPLLGLSGVLFFVRQMIPRVSKLKSSDPGGVSPSSVSAGD